MNILRGTFRLSLLVGIAAFAWFLLEASQAAGREAADARELWSTQRCGQVLIGKDVTPYLNPYGNIDLSRVGCSHRQFFSNMREIEDSLKEPDPFHNIWHRAWWQKFEGAWTGALGLFVLTNVLGLTFLGARRAFRWVSAGYRAK